MAQEEEKRGPGRPSIYPELEHPEPAEATVEELFRVVFAAVDQPYPSLRKHKSRKHAAG